MRRPAPPAASQPATTQIVLVAQPVQPPETPMHRPGTPSAAVHWASVAQAMQPPRSEEQAVVPCTEVTQAQ